MTKLTRVRPQHGRYYYILDLEERHAKTGRPKQRWVPLTRESEGQPALVAALEKLLGTPTERVGTMPAHLETFRAEHQPTLKSHETRSEFERMVGVLKAAFRQFDSDAVDAGLITRFLQDNYARKLNTRAKMKGRLSQFFSWCCRNSYTGVKVNPCREIKMSRPAKRRGAMTAERFWAIWAGLTPMHRCALELLFLLRQRPTEIRLLRDSHIGPEAHPDYIHVEPTKTEDETGLDVHIRRTPEIDAVIARARALRPARKVVGLKDDPFIIQTRTGDGYTKTGFYEPWRDAVIAAGLQGQGVTMKSVRPFALTAMENQGADLREIQKAAVHSSVTTTEGYLEQHREKLSDFRMQLPEKP